LLPFRLLSLFCCTLRTRFSSRHLIRLPFSDLETSIRQPHPDSCASTLDFDCGSLRRVVAPERSHPPLPALSLPLRHRQLSARHTSHPLPSPLSAQSHQRRAVLTSSFLPWPCGQGRNAHAVPPILSVLLFLLPSIRQQLFLALLDLKLPRVGGVHG
jgi:hypothetical protein